MKRLLLLTVVLMAVAAVASATPCSGSTTIAALIALNGTGGCTSQGVTFSNFSYSGGGLGPGLVLATLVTSHSAGQDSDGWSFGPSGGWTSSFTLGFTVSVTPGNPEGVGRITNTVDQIFAGITGSSNTVSASDIESVGVTPNPLNMIATSAGGETVQSSAYKLTTVATASTITIAAGKGLGLSNYEQVFYSSPIPGPEPVTFILIGSGLIGLTFLRRRLHKG